MDENFHTIALVKYFAKAKNRAIATAAKILAGEARLLDRLDKGGSITFKRAIRIRQNASNLWPFDHPWPADIPRPPPAADSRYAQAAQAQNLNNSAQDSENPLSLNSRGEIASPKALAASLLPSYAGEALMQAMMDSYYQLTRQYADGRPKADKSPRKGTRAARLLAALVAAGDVRFRARIDQAAEARAIAKRIGLVS